MLTVDLEAEQDMSGQRRQRRSQIHDPVLDLTGTQGGTYREGKKIKEKLSKKEQKKAQQE